MPVKVSGQTTAPHMDQAQQPTQVAVYRTLLNAQNIKITMRLYKPEWPEASSAVPKKSIYSVIEAWRTHAAPIQPPALMKTHCRSDAGKMCPGYFALRSLCTFWNAFFTSYGAVASAFQEHFKVIHEINISPSKCISSSPMAIRTAVRQTVGLFMENYVFWFKVWKYWQNILLFFQLDIHKLGRWIPGSCQPNYHQWLSNLYKYLLPVLS